MGAHLLDVSLRVLPLALLAAALLRIPRMRNAAWAHAAWTMVLLSMLLLFAVGPALKPIPLRLLPAVHMQPEPVWGRLLTCGACGEIDRRLENPPQDAILPHPESRSWSAADIALVLYVSVAAVLFGRLLLGSWLARRLLTGSVPAGDFYESPRIAVPLTIGVFLPVILVPSAWRSWDGSKLDAVLLHERSHIRRRDSLIAFLAGLNRCLFWFHPLAWWIESKLAFLAEQACDEACVSALENRREYARLLLEMASAVEASGGRISGHALAMARPSQVHRRIDAILDETRLVHRGLTGLSWVAVLLCGAPIIYAAGSLRVEPKQSPVSVVRPVTAPAPPAFVPLLQAPRPQPVLIAQAPVAAPAAAPAEPSSVVFPVSVTEPAGRLVTGLTVENFKIVSGEITQQITGIDSAEGRHSVIVLDTISNNNAALDAFRKALDPRDESSVLEGPPASDVEGLMQSILGAVTAVKQKQNPVKAVVVVMQGGQPNPMATERSLSSIIRVAARSPRVVISFADLGDAKQTAAPPGALTQQWDIRILTQATGGQVIPVARPEELPAALEKVALGLRNQYLLTFVPQGLPAGTFGRARVEIVNVNGLPQLQVIGPLFYGR